MIKKLYNLKKLQTDQKVSQKLQILNNVKSIDEEIDSLKDSLLHTSVNRYGPVSDFAVLEIHKATMKEKIYKLEIEKSKLLKLVAMLDKEIVELQKESEQFKYILTQEKKEKIRKFLKEEDNKADEYVQSKMIMLTKE
ncbi:MAG: hypothetical protein RBR23_08380 [Arcobacteraceae bacterium]|jgi:hypothetical protein|nr:hypothetical protein [Arcobacteraceae bacterium]